MKKQGTSNKNAETNWKKANYKGGSTYFGINTLVVGIPLNSSSIEIVSFGEFAAVRVRREGNSYFVQFKCNNEGLRPSTATTTSAIYTTSPVSLVSCCLISNRKYQREITKRSYFLPSMPIEISLVAIQKVLWRVIKKDRQKGFIILD